MEIKPAKPASTLPEWTILVVIAGLLFLLFDLGKIELARVLLRMG